MELSWNITYRGPLDSCNYDCSYCPFGKRRNSREELARDARMLERFVEWVHGYRRARIGILFTPWGEAMIHPPYQQAMVTLSRLPHVQRVAIQTNLAGPVSWLAAADLTRVALWATFHPTQVETDRFLARCHELDQLGVRYSVGLVGRREHLDAMEILRARLAPGVYLWVNAYKDEPHYYDAATVERITAVDPLFEYNLTAHASRGRACFAGETSFAVDGEGGMYRCHFLRAPLGNLYRDDPAQLLAPRPCPRGHCTCHIGYVNLKHLRLADRFGDDLLARIPRTEAWAPSGIA